MQPKTNKLVERSSFVWSNVLIRILPCGRKSAQCKLCRRRVYWISSQGYLGRDFTTVPGSPENSNLRPCLCWFASYMLILFTWQARPLWVAPFSLASWVQTSQLSPVSTYESLKGSGLICISCLCGSNHCSWEFDTWAWLSLGQTGPVAICQPQPSVIPLLILKSNFQVPEIFPSPFSLWIPALSPTHYPLQHQPHSPCPQFSLRFLITHQMQMINSLTVTCVGRNVVSHS